MIPNQGNNGSSGGKSYGAYSSMTRMRRMFLSIDSNSLSAVIVRVIDANERTYGQRSGPLRALCAHEKALKMSNSGRNNHVIQ